MFIMYLYLRSNELIKENPYHRSSILKTFSILTFTSNTYFSLFYKKIVFITAILLSIIWGTSCVNSGMYNTAIGKKAKVRYDSDASDYRVNETIDEDGYRHVDLSDDKEDKKPEVKSDESSTANGNNSESVPIISDNGASGFVLVKRTIRDTVIETKTNIEKIPIDEARKDSMLFALVKNTELSQAQKDKKLADFIKSHNKKVSYLDTNMMDKIIYDTMWVADMDSSAKDSVSKGQLAGVNQALLQKVKELERKVALLQDSLITRKERKKIKKEIVYTAQELRRMGELDGGMYHDASPAFIFPLGGLGLTILLLATPLAGLSILTFLGGLVAGIYFLVMKPTISWYKVPSKHRFDPNYQKGYEKAAKRKNARNALWGFIPSAILALLMGIGIVLLLLFLI